MRRGQLTKSNGGILANYHSYYTKNQEHQSSLQPIFKSLKDARLERKLSKQRDNSAQNYDRPTAFIDFKAVRDKVKIHKQHILKTSSKNLTPRDYQ